MYCIKHVLLVEVQCGAARVVADARCLPHAYGCKPKSKHVGANASIQPCKQKIRMCYHNVSWLLHGGIGTTISRCHVRITFRVFPGSQVWRSTYTHKWSETKSCMGSKAWNEPHNVYNTRSLACAPQSNPSPSIFSFVTIVIMEACLVSGWLSYLHYFDTICTIEIH